MLWNRFCIIHLSIVCGGRAVPFLWKVLEHKSSTVAFTEYKLMLRLATKLLSSYSNIMLLADRGFANHELVDWLQNSQWHYCLRLPCDVILHKDRKHPIELKYLFPQKAEAVLCHDVGLWLDGKYRCNVVLANVKGVKEPWAVRGLFALQSSYDDDWQSFALRTISKLVYDGLNDLMLDLKTEILQAEQKIRSYIRETPLDYSLALSRSANCQVFFKLENLQLTSSFKVRGAMNKLLSLTPQQRERGVVTASSGNHGAAIAYGLGKLKIPGIIFVPENASKTKIEAIARFGGEVLMHGKDSVITENYARTYAEQNNKVYISPYNDLQVIGGQGTIAIELARQLEQIDAVFVPVGGGGLISGIAGYLKSVLPNVRVIGCLPENSPVMAESIKANRIIERESLPTLSDGTAGGVEQNAITFDFCRSFVDEFVLVSEAEIASAMKLFIETHHQLLEGAAGVAIAAFWQARTRFRDRNIVIIICGANISLETLKTIL